MALWLTGIPVQAEEEANNPEIVKSSNLFADEIPLTENMTSIRIQASGEAVLDVSPLSYANLVLHSETFSNDADMKNAMTALYHYYSAAQSVTA